MASLKAIVSWNPEEGSKPWKPTTLDQLGKYEGFLEEVLAANPTLLCLESRRTGCRGPYSHFRQLELETPSNRPIKPDLVFFSASGHVIVVEVKRHANKGLHDRTVIAQIIDYASAFSTVTEPQALEMFGESSEDTWTEFIESLFPDDDASDELADLLLSRMQSGELNLVIACDKIPPSLPDVVSGIATQRTLGFELDLVEVTPYVREISENAEIIFVPTTKLSTEIVSRTAVTVTYRQGDEQPSTRVETTSVQEIEDSIRTPPRGGGSTEREERLEYWMAFITFLRNKTSDFKPPRATGGPSIDLPLLDTGAELKVWLYGNPVDRLGVRLKHRKGFIESLAATQRSRINEELGADVFTLGKMEKPMIQTERAVDITNKADWPEQHEWILTRIRALQKSLLPYLSDD